jgi:hypothetical protein
MKKTNLYLKLECYYNHKAIKIFISKGANPAKKNNELSATFAPLRE